MTTTTSAQIEGTGEKYDLNKLLDMRLRTRHAVYKIAAGISVGMVEEDARAMARDVLKSMGMRRGWHHVISRTTFSSSILARFMGTLRVTPAKRSS